MARMDNITKIHVCWNLMRAEVSAEEIPGRIGKHRSTVYRWIKGLKQKGIHQFLRDYENAKKGRRQRKTNGELKELIYAIREENRHCCGEKIRYFLWKDHRIRLSLSTIYRILGERYELRSKWKKNEKRGKVLKGTRPREVVQVDTVDLGDFYAFTAIDTYTREASVILKIHLDSIDGEEALVRQLKFFGEVERIQRDGGPEFKDRWQKMARERVKVIRTARPYKKNEQAFIERFNGILRKECVGYVKYKKTDLLMLTRKVDEFLRYYHDKRPHLSLQMLTPHEFAMSHLT